MRKLKHDLLAPIMAQLEANGLTDAFGGDEAGRKLAEFMVEVQHELPRGTLSSKNRSNSIKPNPTESNPIQPKIAALHPNGSIYEYRALVKKLC